MVSCRSKACYTIRTLWLAERIQVILKNWVNNTMAPQLGSGERLKVSRLVSKEPLT